MTTATMALTELAEKGADIDVLRQMVQFMAQRLMELDVEARCGAGYDEKNPERLNSRNGYRERTWDTRAGSVELKPHVPTVDDRIRASAASILPFKLTAGQKLALKEIVDDMRQPQPMHRLLQGDVGAGKTIVALLSAIVAMENGLQVAYTRSPSTRSGSLTPIVLASPSSPGGP